MVEPRPVGEETAVQAVQPHRWAVFQPPMPLEKSLHWACVAEAPFLLLEAVEPLRLLLLLRLRERAPSVQAQAHRRRLQTATSLAQARQDAEGAPCRLQQAQASLVQFQFLQQPEG